MEKSVSSFMHSWYIFYVPDVYFMYIFRVHCFKFVSSKVFDRKKQGRFFIKLIDVALGNFQFWNIKRNISLLEMQVSLQNILDWYPGCCRTNIGKWIALFRPCDIKRSYQKQPSRDALRKRYLLETLHRRTPMPK